MLHKGFCLKFFQFAAEHRKYAKIIRSYAMDPGALVLEYQILFENGKLSINGKEVM